MEIREWNCGEGTCEAALGDLLHAELVNPGEEHVAGAVVLGGRHQVRLFLHADGEAKL